jgi:hypothetical protein
MTTLHPAAVDEKKNNNNIIVRDYGWTAANPADEMMCSQERDATTLGVRCYFKDWLMEKQREAFRFLFSRGTYSV